jgi:hypothetical protein
MSERVRGGWEGEKAQRIFDTTQNFDQILNLVINAQPGTFTNSSGKEINVQDVVRVKTFAEKGNLVPVTMVECITKKNGLREAVVRAMAPRFAAMESLTQIKAWLDYAKTQEDLFQSATGIEACIPYFNPNDGWDKFDPENPYWCRAGYRLFSINQVAGATADQVRLVITGCVDNWSKAPLGEVVKDPETGKYAPKFNVPDIERLRAAVVNKTIATCWGGVGNPNTTNPRGHIEDPKAEAVLFASLRGFTSMW